MRGAVTLLHLGKAPSARKRDPRGDPLLRDQVAQLATRRPVADQLVRPGEFGLPSGELGQSPDRQVEALDGFESTHGQKAPRRLQTLSRESARAISSSSAVMSAGIASIWCERFGGP